MSATTKPKSHGNSLNFSNRSHLKIIILRRARSKPGNDQQQITENFDKEKFKVSPNSLSIMKFTNEDAEYDYFCKLTKTNEGGQSIFADEKFSIIGTSKAIFWEIISLNVNFQSHLWLGCRKIRTWSKMKKWFSTAR